jgi:hypothetical protein
MVFNTCTCWSGYNIWHAQLHNSFFRGSRRIDQPVSSLSPFDCLLLLVGVQKACPLKSGISLFANIFEVVLYPVSCSALQLMVIYCHMLNDKYMVQLRGSSTFLFKTIQSASRLHLSNQKMKKVSSPHIIYILSTTTIKQSWLANLTLKWSICMRPNLSPQPSDPWVGSLII